jgi:hypothetical protein
MRITGGRLVQSALVGIAVCAFVQSMAAQQSHLAPTAVDQIVREVLRALVPPGESLSRVSVTKRKIFFDRGRTMAAFGHPVAPTSFPDLGIQVPATAGSRSLLSDCDQSGTKPCKQLGWSAYVWMEPISITSSQVVVRAYLSWPERGRTPFVEGMAPTGKASLAGFATEVHLAQSANGQWQFVRKGRTIVGE